MNVRGGVPLPSNRREWAALGIFVLLPGAGAAAAAGTALVFLLIDPFLRWIFGVTIGGPSAAVVYANIAAGLAMPVLAALTAWYALQMDKFVRQEGERVRAEREKREAELHAFRQELLQEIESHEWREYEAFNERYLVFSTDVYDNNLDLVAQLDDLERTAIHDYYVGSVKTIASMSGQGTGENSPLEIGEELYDKMGEEFKNHQGHVFRELYSRISETEPDPDIEELDEPIEELLYE